MHPILIIGFIFVLLTGCNGGQKIDIISSKELLIKCNSSVGIVVKTGHPAYEVVDEWVRLNLSGWSKSPASYAPTTVVKFGGKELNFMPEFVVYNDGSKQLTKALTTTKITSALCGNI